MVNLIALISSGVIAGLSSDTEIVATASAVTGFATIFALDAIRCCCDTTACLAVAAEQNLGND